MKLHDMLWQSIAVKNRTWVILTVVIFLLFFTYTFDNVVLVCVCVCVKYSSIQEKRSHSPTPTCVSMKSARSMDRPVNLAEGRVPAGQW